MSEQPWADAPGALDLALAVLRNPGRHTDLLRGKGVLPSDCIEVIKLALDAVRQSDQSRPEERHTAALFFVEHVLLAEWSDHYRLFGLKPAATDADIREHYRLMVAVFHPDRSGWLGPHREGLAARINLAYQVLRNPQRRAAYDLELRGPDPVRAEVPPAAAATHAHVRPEPRVRPTGRAIPPSPLLASLPVYVQRHLPQFVLGMTALVGMLIVLAAFVGRSAPPLTNGVIANKRPAGPAQLQDLSNTPEPPPTVQAVALGKPEAAADTADVQLLAAVAATTSAPAPESGITPEPGPEPRPKATPAPKAESHPLSRPEARAEPKAEPRTESSPEPRPVSRPAPRPARQPQPKPEPRPEPKPERRSVPEAEPRPAPGPVPVEKPLSSGGDAATVAQDPAPASAVAIASAASPVVPDPPRLGMAEAREVLDRFRSAYRQGDLAAFMRLFDLDARSSSGPLSRIRADYQDLFRQTVSREFGFLGLRWSADEATAEGEFIVTVRPVGDPRDAVYSGTVRLEFVRRGNNILIKGLFHQLR